MKIFTKFMIASALTTMCSISLPAFAGPYEDGIEALARKDYLTAYNLLSPLANSGNSMAQFEIAYLYLNNHYGAKSEEKSTGMMWLRRSADSGHLIAQKEMRMFWDLGRAYGVSYEEQEKYILMAAKQGDADSQSSVGDTYRHEKNYTKARYWYEKAAAQGHEDAAKSLKKLPAEPLLGFSLYDRSASSTNPLTAAQIKKIEDDGFASLKADNEGWALILWAQAAEAGSIYAQISSGILYSYGKTTEHSKEKAMYFFEKAMAQNHIPAFYQVAMLHDKGIFFPQSDQKAYEFYKKSSDLGSGKGAYHAGNFAESLGDLKGALALIKLGAERGYPDAQANLGIIYDGSITEYKDNNIVTVDLEKSMKWLLKAAQQDFHYAIYRVGYNYNTGTGVPKSLASAEYWHKRGARMGMGESMMSLSKADQEEIRKERLQSAKTKAHNGDVEAQYTLAVAYRDGKDVKQSTALSEHWLAKAARRDMPEAMADLAEIYDDGQGTPRDTVRAKIYYMQLAKNKQEAAVVVTRAIRAYNNDDYDLAFVLAKPYADDGYNYAQNIIGKMYNFGRGVPTSKDKALYYFKMAGDTGFAEAQHNLGFLYEYSYNNPVEAARWYRKSANQEHVRSLKSLALMYSSGRGVTKNYSKAAELYGRAAAAGDVDAASNQKLALNLQRRDQRAYARSQAETARQRQQLAAERKKFEAQEQKRREQQAPQAVQARTYTFPEPKVNKWSLAYLLTPRARSVSGYRYNYNTSSNYSGSNSSYSSGYSTAIDSGAATRSQYAVHPPPRMWHDGN